MNDTMQSKLMRLLEDGGIYRVDISYKCKTKDGMLYTMEHDEFPRRDGESQDGFGCRVVNAAIGTTLRLTDEAEKDGYWYSVGEMVSIRKSEIIRIWAELGDIYTNSTLKEA